VFGECKRSTIGNSQKLWALITRTKATREQFCLQNKCFSGILFNTLKAVSLGEGAAFPTEYLEAAFPCSGFQKEKGNESVY